MRTLTANLIRGRQTQALTGVAFLAGLLSCAFGLGTEPAGCPGRVVHIRVTDREIAQIEEGMAQGHQPWRSNPYVVAETALGRVESGLNPGTMDSIPYKRTILSPASQLFRFELIDSRHIDEISVRRLRWHNPRTGKVGLTGAWWATKAVISNCAIVARIAPRPSHPCREKTCRGTACRPRMSAGPDAGRASPTPTTAPDYCAPAATRFVAVTLPAPE